MWSRDKLYLAAMTILKCTASVCGALVLSGCSDGPPSTTNGNTPAQITLARGAHIDSQTFRRDPRVSLMLKGSDGNAQPITLAPSQIRVIENGREVERSRIQFTNGPVTFALLLDTSGSMNQPAVPGGLESKVVAVKRAALDILRLMRPNDRMIVFAFDSQPRRLKVGDKELDLTSDTTLLRQAIESTSVPTYPTSTAYYQAVKEALIRLKDQPGRRTIIALTDGYDNHSDIYNCTRAQVEQLSNQFGIPVMAIGFGDSNVDIPQLEKRWHENKDRSALHVLEYAVDAQSLKLLAENTGGEALITPRVEDLRQLFTRATQQAQSTYPLTYLSPHADAGGVRNVVVEISYGGKQHRLESGYQYGMAAGEDSVMDQEDLRGLLFLVAMGAVLVAMLPFGIREAAFGLRRRRLYASQVRTGVPPQQGELSSPISDTPFAQAGNVPSIWCPNCGLRHLLRDWEANEGCARGDYSMRKESGISVWLQVYYGALVGGVGGLMAWCASWMVLPAYMENASIPTVSIYLLVSLGALLGWFVSSMGAIFQQSIRRAALEGIVGALLGAVAGYVAAVFGEWIFSSTGAFLRGGWAGRMASWAVMGTIVGLAQGLYGRILSFERAIRGMLGGLIGGALGGIIFQAMLGRTVSTDMARLSFVAVGFTIGLAITISLNSGRYWLVLTNGNSPLRELSLIPSPKAITLGADSSSHFWIKHDPGAAPSHATLTFESGCFIIEDTSRRFVRNDGTPLYPPLQVNNRPVTRCQLNHEDLIRVGNTVIRFERRDERVARTANSSPIGGARAVASPIAGGARRR